MAKAGMVKMNAGFDFPRVRGLILRWFAAHGRDLPWRRTRDPWAVLVSECMLQQTQVERVIPKYLDFLGRWPTPAALAKAPLADVLKTWSGLGYNRRAKYLREAANEMCARYGGQVPVDAQTLESLPGIGRYTARAVASFAANADVVLWDANVRRIFFRLMHGGEFARRLPDDTAFEAALRIALPAGRSRDWHGALMDFGSAVCVSRAPSCISCPLRSSCAAASSFLAGKRARLPLVRPQSRFKGSRRQVRGAIIRLLAARGSIEEKPLRTELEAELGRLRGEAAVSGALADLENEGLIVRRSKRLALP